MAADLATRDQLEQIATDTERPASARISHLRQERRRTTDPETLGTIDTYIGDLELEREAATLAGAQEELLTRENADVRDDLLARELASEDDLNAAGYLAHDDLDQHREDGTLQESVLGAFGAALNPVLLRQLARKRHRNRGKFAPEMHLAPQAPPAQRAAPQISPGPGPEPAAAEATRNVFQGEETTRVAQEFPTQEKLYEAAAEAKPDFDATLKGVAEDLGAEVPDFEQAVKNASERPEQPQVILAPLKGQERANEKIETKYDGDHNKLQDVVRGTVVVPHLRDFPAMVETLRKHAEAHGFKIRKAENRYVDGPEDHNVGPTSSGYRDAAVALVHPNGTVTELQLQTAPMFTAKESEGHKLYEESRSLEADLKRREKEGAPASPGTEEQGSKLVARAIARIKELQQLSDKLYRSAYEASYA